ncbi:FAD-dependent oxidoreductase [Methylogaea oryzae]|uniref:FAD-dependent oxidoreductase n=1 Tax=Methylogaea oryzae TaxID=1295382 RepID=UPI000AE2E640|nr:FAD-dependent oxidoreductase [Methylogaea oryzae]
MSSKQHNPIPKIVVVGGGAGGLELVTRLGNSLGRRGEAEITLVDCSKTHVWKPLLHEVAAGTLDSHEDELEYLAQANTNHFRFILGRMQGWMVKPKPFVWRPFWTVSAPCWCRCATSVTTSW